MPSHPFADFRVGVGARFRVEGREHRLRCWDWKADRCYFGFSVSFWLAWPGATFDVVVQSGVGDAYATLVSQGLANPVVSSSLPPHSENQFAVGRKAGARFIRENAFKNLLVLLIHRGSLKWELFVAGRDMT